MNEFTLKELRKKRGYTQKQMAEFLGYKGKSGYCQLEKGLINMTVKQAEKLSKILNEDIIAILFACRVHDKRTKSKVS